MDTEDCVNAIISNSLDAFIASLGDGIDVIDVLDEIAAHNADKRFIKALHDKGMLLPVWLDDKEVNPLNSFIWYRRVDLIEYIMTLGLPEIPLERYEEMSTVSDSDFATCLIENHRLNKLLPIKLPVIGNGVRLIELFDGTICFATEETDNEIINSAINCRTILLKKLKVPYVLATTARFYEMRPTCAMTNCEVLIHQNEAVMWMKGYALSYDGKWDIHVWCYDDKDNIIETVERKRAYIGAMVNYTPVPAHRPVPTAETPTTCIVGVMVHSTFDIAIMVVHNDSLRKVQQELKKELNKKGYPLCAMQVNKRASLEESDSFISLVYPQNKRGRKEELIMFYYHIPAATNPIMNDVKDMMMKVGRSFFFYDYIFNNDMIAMSIPINMIEIDYVFKLADDGKTYVLEGLPNVSPSYIALGNLGVQNLCKAGRARRLDSETLLVKNMDLYNQ